MPLFIMRQRRRYTNFASVRERRENEQHSGENRSNKQKGRFDMKKSIKNFGETKIKFPINLQFFAEGDGDGGDGGSNDNNDVGGDDNAPSYEELAARLAQAEVEAEKYKNLNDKSSAEAADYKKQLRAKLSAEEQQNIAKKEADEAKDARIKELEEKMAVIDNAAFWGGKSIGMDESLAKATAEAEATGDKEAFRKNIAKHIKAIKDAAYQQALADRPDPHAGNGDTDKNAVAIEKAAASAKRMGGANEDILKHYRR